jgi:hypothetical protein
MTNTFPVLVDGDTLTGAKFNILDTYRLIHAESCSYNSGTYYVEYSYTGGDAASGVLLVATAYCTSVSNGSADDITLLTTQVGGVVKQTNRVLYNTKHGVYSHNYTIRRDYPIRTLLDSGDMDLAANQTLRIESDNTNDKITSLLVYVK